MQTYFEQDFFKIYYDKTNKIIITEWRLPPTSQEFREGMDVVIKALQYFNVSKVIFDTVAMGVVLEADQEWISSDWYGRAVKAGYSQVAFVLPKDVFTDMCVKETVELTTDRIPTAYFESRSEAIDWMNEF
ncbi:MAG TPA: hypothetical protein VIM65_21650 [Cyclobacteriaceae bacterium]